MSYNNRNRSNDTTENHKEKKISQKSRDLRRGH